MSESLNDVAFDLELEDTLPQSEEFEDLSLLENVHKLAVPVRSITNSPGYTPKSSTISNPPLNPLSPPTSTSVTEGEIRPIRRARRVSAVRVDAWAVPASANWSRNRTPIRKVNRVSRSTDWALPF